jgi:hypothetical protein
MDIALTVRLLFAGADYGCIDQCECNVGAVAEASIANYALLHMVYYFNGRVMVRLALAIIFS